jgi:hypothetical protein
MMVPESKWCLKAKEEKKGKTMSKDKSFVLTNPGCEGGKKAMATRNDIEVAKTLGRRYGEGTIITCYVDGSEVSVPWVLKKDGQWVVKD